MTRRLRFTPLGWVALAAFTFMGVMLGGVYALLTGALDATVIIALLVSEER